MANPQADATDRPQAVFSSSMELADSLAADLDAAFPALVTTLGGPVYTAALRLCGRDEAEDVAQEAFVRAYRALRGYSPERVKSLCLRPWMLTIALNVARNALRTKTRHPETMLSENDGQATADTADLRATLAAALLRLPLEARQAVVLRHVIGCSTKETAEILDRPTGTVKAQVSRALTRLRTELEDQP